MNHLITAIIFSMCTPIFASVPEFNSREKSAACEVIQYILKTNFRFDIHTGSCFLAEWKEVSAQNHEGSWASSRNNDYRIESQSKSFIWKQLNFICRGHLYTTTKRNLLVTEPLAVSCVKQR